MLLISALPPEGGFKMSVRFQHLWPLSQKNDVQIFERQSSQKIIRQNVTRGSDFQWFWHHNYQVSLRFLMYVGTKHFVYYLYDIVLQTSKFQDFSVKIQLKMHLNSFLKMYDAFSFICFYPLFWEQVVHNMVAMPYCQSQPCKLSLFRFII